MLKRIGLAAAVLIAALVAFIATRPAHYHIERSLEMKAPAKLVFMEVADFHAWREWSPWEGLDPAMKSRISGPTASAGSTYEWWGNDKVGEGRMTVLRADPARSLGIRLEFLKPWKSVTQTDFSFAEAGGTTRVTWAMDGENDFVGKAFCLVMDMDKTVGGDFARGLARLKSVTEAQAASAAARTIAY